MRSFFAKSSAKTAMVTIIALLLTFASDAQNMWIKSHLPARDRVTEETIRLKVGFLTDSICSGRGTGTTGAVETAAWIAREFEKAKLMKSKGSYYHRFKTEKGICGTNVIGFMPNSSKKAHNRYVIVGAHFDHLGTINGTMYPGADSNASGTAALVSIAEMFSAMKMSGKTWDSNIIFVAFDANGHDLAGSGALWKMIERGELTDPVSGGRITKKMITLMVNIDQVGCSLSPLKSGRKDYMIVLGNHTLGPDRQERLDMCNRLYRINLELSETYYGSVNFTKMFYRLSDQRVFIDNKIPAVMFTSGITMNNNKTRDNAASLNYPVLKRRIYLMYHWIEKML
jgi:hypothetical protein